MKKVLVGVVLMSALITLSGCSLFKKTGSDETANGAAALEVVPAQGATVSVNYVGKLTDGTVFDTNIEEEAKKAGSGVYSAQRPYTPLTFTVGQGQMIPGFEDAVVGMKKGETKTVTITADKAYGEPKKELLFTTGSALFEQAGIKPVLGQTYSFGGAAGKVVSLSGNQVTLDFNHQLAGKDLQFTITLLDVNATTGVSPEPTTTVETK